MTDEIIEEDLLRSIEEVDAKIQNFRKKVRALLADMQTEGRQSSAEKSHSSAA